MKVQRRSTANRRTCSRSCALVLVVTATMCLFPASAWSQDGEWTVYNTSNSGLPYRGVTALAFDEQGNAWVGTGRWWAFEGGGLAKFDGENWTVYNSSNSGLSNNDTVSLSVGPDGNIWHGSENGLSRFDGQNWTVYNTSNSGMRDNQCGAPTFDAQGNAWIACGCVAKFDGQGWTVYYTGNSGVPHDFVTDVAIDAHGNVWASTFGGGVAKFDGQTWTVYNTGNSNLTHNDVSFLDTDGVGNVWAGTYGGGIARFDGQSWTSYRKGTSELPDNWIWNISVDPEGSVWAGTKAGLAKFDGTTWMVFNTVNSKLPDNDVYYAAFDTQGRVWIGTQDGGLAVYRPLPLLDLNEDETVDFTDFSMLAPYWGLYSTPFCDERVDCKYLTAMADYWLKEILPVNLVAYFKLNETEGGIVHDSAGDYDGELQGEPIWQSDMGVVDGALELDGANNYIETPFILSPGDGPFSVFVWVKTETVGKSIISQTGTYGVSWLAIDGVGRLVTELQGSDRGAVPLPPGIVITDNAWHWVGFTWEGAYRALYVDGVEVAKDTGPQSVTGAIGRLHIGADKTPSANSFFSGLIDDVRIYNRAIEP